MPPRDIILKMLHAAAQAPSGDNAQPWRFEVSGSTIAIFNVPGRDYSPYNFRERGSFFAHGAALENLVIAAAALGYAAEVALFPEAADENYVARVVLAESQPADDPLIDYIAVRATNRRPYRKQSLAPADRAAISEVAESRSERDSLLVCDDPAKIREFASVVSLSDQLIFEEKSIHDAIFDSIRWTEKEEAAKRGMYVKTLELPPPARAMFSLLRNWGTLTTLNRIGISKFIAKQSAAVYGTAVALGMIVIPDAAPASYVEAGRWFERLWLTATQRGVSIQPIAALPYLAQRIAAGDAGELSGDHAEKVTAAQNVINQLFGKKDGVVAMMFRMGYADKPSAHSRKLAPEVIFKN